MRGLILACALVLLPALALADEVLLKGGGKISGRILSRTDTAVQVDVGAGIITVPMASVLSIEASDRLAHCSCFERLVHMPGVSQMER